MEENIIVAQGSRETVLHVVFEGTHTTKEKRNR